VSGSLFFRFVVETYVRMKSYDICIRKFTSRSRFPGVSTPYKPTFITLLNKFRTKDSLARKKLLQSLCVFFSERYYIVLERVP